MDICDIRKILAVIGLSAFVVSSNAFAQASSQFSPLTAKRCDQLLEKDVITNKNPVPCRRLSQVNFDYMSEGGVIKTDGELVVLDVLAPKVSALFHELLKNGFVIEKAHPIEEYSGDDKKSMANNNSSAFNGRAITGGSRWSMHAYGAAIDINPVQNPFIDISDDGTANISPAKSSHYAVNRLKYRPNKKQRPGMAEEVVNLFAENGFFIWGGFWNYPIDYQHFQVGPRSFVELLVSLDYEKGETILNKTINTYKECREVNADMYNEDKLLSVCIASTIDSMPTK